MEEINQLQYSQDQLSDAGSIFAGIGIGAVVFLSILSVVLIAARWKVFAKAGQPGWAILVPIYNIIVLFKVAKAPLWWLLMFFIPIANIIFAIKLTHQISVRFGKGGGFTAGLIFLPIVFWPILGFGSAQYEDSINHGDSILDA
tara:strand:+ start:4539 stop:4970 length:432 start_codon:yes stop_codon:yes gene_type:complete